MRRVGVESLVPKQRQSQRRDFNRRAQRLQLQLFDEHSREAVRRGGYEVAGRDDERDGGEMRNHHGRPSRQPSLSEQRVNHSQPLFLVKDRDMFRLGVLAQRNSSADLQMFNTNDANVTILPQQFSPYS